MNYLEIDYHVLFKKKAYIKYLTVNERKIRLICESFELKQI